MFRSSVISRSLTTCLSGSSPIARSPDSVAVTCTSAVGSSSRLSSTSCSRRLPRLQLTDALTDGPDALPNTFTLPLAPQVAEDTDDDPEEELDDFFDEDELDEGEDDGHFSRKTS